MKGTYSVKPERPCKACAGTGAAHKIERGQHCRIYPFTACKACGGTGKQPDTSS